MATMPNLGLFARLPYELREKIWAELAPTPAQGISDSNTDLSILRASHFLHNEIDEVIHRRSTLEFDIDPVYHPTADLCTVSFRRKHRLLDHGGADCPSPPVSWTLQSVASAKARGFGNMAFHKFDQVVVNIPSPDPDDVGELFCLWQKVRGLVSLFRGGTQIKSLLIRLLERESDGQNWIDRLDWPSTAYTPAPARSTCQHDHDVPILPFCTLPNLKALRVDTYSEEFTELMDWYVIDGLIKLVRDSNRERERANAGGNAEAEAKAKSLKDKFKGKGKSKASDKSRLSARADLERRNAFEYYWMHSLLWTYADGSTTADLMRRETLREWARDGCKSVFEKEICRIIQEYPEFLNRQSSNVLRDMHYVGVCLNAAAGRCRSASEAVAALDSAPAPTPASIPSSIASSDSGSTSPSDDTKPRTAAEIEKQSEEDWNTLLPAGLPVLETGEFVMAVGHLITDPIYCDSVREDSEKYEPFDRLVRKWRLRFRQSLWWHLKRRIHQKFGIPMMIDGWYR
ncbi:hypothetical protein ACJ73_00727 [Blastomyces percursus]|uniref:Uncharacterized protein n=1 Tax=Blastomyces percursus TaxID=1658174 RepID=A0A1J9RIR4_9EURO|nr:hypothetical protein ACJ73_00727 [Blastomyces percursus]